MIEPPIPADEPERLAALRELRVLDTPDEERFDRITRIAGDLFQVPIALVSLIDTDRQWFKSKVGLTVGQTPRTISFCGHAILADTPLIVEDALADERFADNPLVTGAPGIRFYAGMPLKSGAGLRLGTLCLIDRAPRRFAAADAHRLADLAAWAERELNLSHEIDRAVAEMRETFVRLVSHELRTPVTGIVGALDLIRSGIAAGQNIKTLARIATDGAGQLNRIVDDIVEIAEFDAKHRDLAPTRIELPLLIEAAMASFAESAQAQQIHLREDLRGATFVTASSKALVRILRSLLDNAIRFSPPGASVVVATLPADGDMIRISVEDSGPGVPADYIPRLFLPFVQADAADNRARNGCGVSLAISRRLATAMGGRLGYEPRPGGGSRFFLDLPG